MGTIRDWSRFAQWKYVIWILSLELKITFIASFSGYTRGYSNHTQRTFCWRAILRRYCLWLSPSKLHDQDLTSDQWCPAYFSDLHPFSERSQIVEESQDNLVVLRCNPPDSFPHRTIQWSKRTAVGKQPLTQSSHYAVSQEGDLHFAYLDREDGRDYVCTVTNLFIMKEVAKTISLRVLPGNIFLNQNYVAHFSKIHLKHSYSQLQCYWGSIQFTAFWHIAIHPVIEMDQSRHKQNKRGKTLAATSSVAYTWLVIG